MSKTTQPPKKATLTEQLRWYLRHREETPFDVAKATGIGSSTLYRFLNDTRGLSHDATDRLAKHLKVRLVRSAK